jgi:hypothetical protein
MARQPSRAALEDWIRKALEPFYEQFDQDAVQDAVSAVIQKKPRRRGRIKSSRGAPDIDLELRDLLVLALVEVVNLARGEDNISWACNWVAKNVTIRGKEMRGGSMWQRSWEKPAALRRIYYKARKRWQEDWVFQENLLHTYQSLIDTRRHYPDFSWGGFGMKGIPTHFDVLFPKRPNLLIKGIDELQALMEQAQSKK